MNQVEQDPAVSVTGAGHGTIRLRGRETAPAAEVVVAAAVSTSTAGAGHGAIRLRMPSAAVSPAAAVVEPAAPVVESPAPAAAAEAVSYVGAGHGTIRLRTSSAAPVGTGAPAPTVATAPVLAVPRGDLAGLEAEANAAWTAYQNYHPGQGRPAQDGAALLARAAGAAQALTAAKARVGG